jgi:hypothetical protein
MYRLFLINSPVAFRAIWAIVRIWLTHETVIRIHICGPVNSTLAKNFADSGIPAAALPPWAGGSNTGKSAFDLINESIEGPHRVNDVGFSAEMLHRLERLRFRGSAVEMDTREFDEDHPQADATPPRARASKQHEGLLFWALLVFVAAALTGLFAIFVVSSQPLADQIRYLTSKSNGGPVHRRQKGD